ncbi:TIGR00304 family membrane protein [Metallosphaera cuprina]|uniref:DUF131 domain-containing protein n=2 Tax=Metallosphaera TaxID=41980 RepID=F4FY10_METCR|nr:conserved hypothetical protein [Metallosphaera cuprina Ar-4]
MRLTLVGMALIFIGFLILLASTFAGPLSGSSFSGVVLIGPIPIIFGKGYSGDIIQLMIIGIIFTIIALIFFLSSIWIFRRSNPKMD